MLRLTRVVPGATSMSIGTSTSVVPASGWRIGSGAVGSAGGGRGPSFPCGGGSSSWISSRSISRSSLGIPGAAIARRSSAASSRLVCSVFCGRWPAAAARAAGAGARGAGGGGRGVIAARIAAGCEAPTGVLPSISKEGTSAGAGPPSSSSLRRSSLGAGSGGGGGGGGVGAVRVLHGQGLEHQLGDSLERVLDADPLDGHRLVERGVQRVHPLVQDLDLHRLRQVALVVLQHHPDLVGVHLLFLQFFPHFL